MQGKISRKEKFGNQRGKKDLRMAKKDIAYVFSRAIGEDKCKLCCVQKSM